MEVSLRMANNLNHRKWYDSPVIFAQVGACLCAGIGGLYGSIAVAAIFEGFDSTRQAAALMAMTLLAFVPFVVFIYPKYKIHFKPLAVPVAILEFLIIAFFMWDILTVEG